LAAPELQGFSGVETSLPNELLSLVPPDGNDSVRNEPEQRLDLRITESENAFRHVLELGFDHWVITYSGGKDSTAVVCLAFELLKNRLVSPAKVDIVYSDTGMEIPTLRHNALRFLHFIKKEAKRLNLPIRCHVRKPETRQGYWFLMLGKGYPPPHQRFRWCTRRLKIDPVKDLVSRGNNEEKTCVITGVRFNESNARNATLHAACSRGGECGQGLWFWQKDKLGVSYLAPIVNWRDCDVWDFLSFEMPLKGWPTKQLFELYQNGQNLRFGCWMCTVVRQDTTMAKLIENGDKSLTHLLEFQLRVRETTSTKLNPASRVKRPDGNLGRLRLNVRKKLFDELLTVQRKVGFEIITEGERRAIRSYWAKST
jgi:DNA sulfur modification protein DndC